MTQRNANIRGIPAIVWGDAADKAYIFVHGKFSCKEEAADLAQKAVPRGHQVVSFDLPEHGDRKSNPYPCDVWNGVRDLRAVYDFARQKWAEIRLCAVSLGAFFSLLAYKDCSIKKALFISPVLDMEALIEGMMRSLGVTESELEEKQTIPAPGGQTLSWQYYRYVKEHPVAKWDVPTRILRGSRDDLVERTVADRFAERFGAHVTVLENGGHWFHTPEQLSFLEKWLERYV